MKKLGHCFFIISILKGNYSTHPEFIFTKASRNRTDSHLAHPKTLKTKCALEKLIIINALNSRTVYIKTQKYSYQEQYVWRYRRYRKKTQCNSRRQGKAGWTTRSSLEKWLSKITILLECYTVNCFINNN